LPGLASVGLTDAVPIADNRQGTSFVRLDAPAADPTASQNANVAWITEGYFEALGVPLIAGRTFTEADTAGRDRVVVINRMLAQQVFGQTDPIGRMVRIGASTQAPFQVVGVVGNERHVGVDADATPSFFLSYRQVPSVRDLSIVVRSSAPPTAASSSWTSLLGPLGPAVSDAIARESLANTIRVAMRRLDPELALFSVRTMDQVVDAAVATPRSMAWLLSSFAVASLLLAAIGVFGVMSHAVSQRTREIGVRMAIGASPYRMLGAILAEGLTQVGLGLIAGVILSIVTARLLTGLLFGVSAMAVTPYLIVVAVLAVVSVIACLVPARRAMRIDPMTALRAE
jgi:putative ABC transport system permease protein